MRKLLLSILLIALCICPTAQGATNGEKVVEIARQQVGKPYVWGAAGPDSFDCSGLCLFAVRQTIGVTVPHNDESQYQWWQANPQIATVLLRGVDVLSPADLRPGDLMFKASPGHEMIYAGGTYIHASGGSVKEEPFDWSNAERFNRFVRLVDPPPPPPPPPPDPKIYRLYKEGVCYQSSSAKRPCTSTRRTVRNRDGGLNRALLCEQVGQGWH